MDPQISTFCALAALITITPGADTMLVFRNTLRGGRRDGFVTAVGICSGLFVHALFSALGLSIILAESAAAFQVVKLAGAAYLVWLGIQSFRSRAQAPMDAPVAREGAGIRRNLTEGVLSNVLNPKVAIFYLALFPQFITAGEHVLGKALLLAGIHNVMGLVWLGVIAVLVARSRELLLRERVRHAVSKLTGLALVALGLRLATTER